MAEQQDWITECVNILWGKTLNREQVERVIRSHAPSPAGDGGGLAARCNCYPWGGIHAVDCPQSAKLAALREVLAALAHEQWSGWMRYLFSRCQPFRDGYEIPHEWASRWERQMDTPYAELREDEKESDRKEADRVIAALRQPPPQKAAERTLASIATMLGWMNIPPQHVLEAEIGALKARAEATPPPADRAGLAASGEPDDFNVRLVCGKVAFEVRTGDGALYTVYLRPEKAGELAAALRPPHA